MSRAKELDLLVEACHAWFNLSKGARSNKSPTYTKLYFIPSTPDYNPDSTLKNSLFVTIHRGLAHMCVRGFCPCGRLRSKGEPNLDKRPVIHTPAGG